MTCIKVTLRKRPISQGRFSLYLDYYPPVRIPETRKMTRRETLGIYIHANPKNEIERSYNREVLAKAEAIRGLRAQSVLNESFGFLDKHRLRASFLDYFRKLALSNNQVWKTAHLHFSKFMDGHCSFGELNVERCLEFQRYLLQADKLRKEGEKISLNTAAGYWMKFRYALKLAYRDKLLQENLYAQLDKIKTRRTRREFLLQEELWRLSRTPCEIPVLKRASLFSCLTGLRISDVLKLTWKEIVPDIGNGYCIRFKTKKTEREVTLPICPEALALCGEKGTGRVFEGLTATMTQGPLKKWIEQAGITKHITFHCFRHTYAVLQLAAGTPITVVRDMLGHEHVTTTEIYLEVLTQNKVKALDKITLQPVASLLSA